MWRESRKIGIVRDGKLGDEITAPSEQDLEVFRTGETKNGVRIIRETRKYRLLTPLFGGGVEPKKADEITVVRATEIRGQLRFWWRALRGGQFRDLEEMKHHEDAIFGSTDQSSALQIVLETVDRGMPFGDLNDHTGTPQNIGSMRSPLSYVAFPLREESDPKVLEGVRFSINVAFPEEFETDVRAAFWAWEVFGGLGGRTRRGFGSVQNEEFKPADGEEILNDIRTRLQELATGSCHEDMPHLAFDPTHYRITSPKPKAVDCWRLIVDKYKKFRQSRASNNRSNWPEPDAIRRKFPPPGHPAHSIPMSTVDKFPRAAFGLPIIFKFKSSDERAGDPRQTSLEGRSKDEKRYASPLCFRVTQCLNGSYVGIVYLLAGTREPKSGVILKGAPGDPRVDTGLDPTEAKSPGLNSLLGGNKNVLEAFLSTL